MENELQLKDYLRYSTFDQLTYPDFPIRAKKLDNSQGWSNKLETSTQHMHWGSIWSEGNTGNIDYQEVC